MTTPITRPCPHCGRPYDITHRSIGGVIWCRSCGQCSRVAVHGSLYLAPCDAPDGTQPTTADAMLVAEMSALRAELLAVKEKNAVLSEVVVQQPRAANDEIAAIRAELEAAHEDNAMLLSALREIDSSEWLPPRVQCQLDRIRQAEHPGRALMAALTRRMSEMEQERDVARAVVDAARAALDAPLFEYRQPLIDALTAYDKAVRERQ